MPISASAREAARQFSVIEVDLEPILESREIVRGNNRGFGLGGDVSIELMPGEVFEFRGTRVEQSDAGSSTWIGASTGDDGFISVTKNGPHVTGSADVGMRQFRFQGAANGRIVVREALPAVGGACREIDESPAQQLLIGGGGGSIPKNTSQTIDLMVLLSNEAVAYLGEQWKAQVDNLVANLNQSFASSQVAANVRVVRYAQIRDFAANGENVLNQVQNLLTRLNSANSPFTSIPSERNQLGADLVVHLVTKLPNGGWCGASNAYRNNSNSNTAFAIAAVNCSADEHVFAHEIGHLLGGLHSSTRDAQLAGAIFPYSFGYTNKESPGNYFRTLMGDTSFASTSGCTSPCTRINRWSSPNQLISIGGAMVPIVPTADAEKSDMVLTLNGSSDFYNPVQGMANLVANHRSTVSTVPGSPATFVSASVCASTPTNLSWTAGTGAVGWYEMSWSSVGDGTSYSGASIIDANSRSLSTYPYRFNTTTFSLRSCNAAGCSSARTLTISPNTGRPPC